MRDIYDLFFELSNEDRMRILYKLTESSLKLSRISEALSLPVQEISRQLSRLIKQGLVEKTVEGEYAITLYAEQVLRFIPSIEFLTINSEYLKSHSMSMIPHEFAMRIGELNSGIFVDDVMKHFHRVELMIQEAEEYIWSMTDQILMSSVGHTQKALERGVEHRFLGPKDIEPPEGLAEEARNRGLTGPQGKSKIKYIDKLDILITVTEKEAHFEFPTLSGKFDYTGIHTRDERAIKWCRELFSHYWESTDIYVPDFAREAI